jgi:hypothetical protein
VNRAPMIVAARFHLAETADHVKFHQFIGATLLRCSFACAEINLTREKCSPFVFDKFMFYSQAF